MYFGINGNKILIWYFRIFWVAMIYFRQLLKTISQPSLIEIRINGNININLMETQVLRRQHLTTPLTTPPLLPTLFKLLTSLQPQLLSCVHSTTRVWARTAVLGCVVCKLDSGQPMASEKGWELTNWLKQRVFYLEALLFGLSLFVFAWPQQKQQI